MFPISSTTENAHIILNWDVIRIKLKWFVVALFPTPKINARFEVLTVLLLKMQVFCDVTPY